MESSTAAAHAEATSHTNFAESTEAVLNLVRVDCGKPCRSQTEVDLHKKRTGHAEFTDKTMEAAKPIDLEAPPKPAAEAKDVDASGKLVEVNKEMLGELKSMGFSVARATRTLHFSGGAVEEEYGDMLRRLSSLITQKCNQLQSFDASAFTDLPLFHSLTLSCLFAHARSSIACHYDICMPMTVCGMVGQERVLAGDERAQKIVKVLVLIVVVMVHVTG
ncbi:F-box protein [Hordeum vulgare]|nr:F-box protein [Hordeum vulgare]